MIQAKPQCLEEAPSPAANNSNVRKNPIFQAMFQTPIPDIIPGFECTDVAQMEKLYPAGTDAAYKVSVKSWLGVTLN